MKRLTPFQLLCVSFGFFLATCDAVPSIEVQALTLFKEAIFDDPFFILSNWNSLDPDPCDWVGVTCSGNQVRKLNISGSSIKGFIAEELFQISSLEELILHGNNLIGPIPMEIGSLKHLKILDLGMNQLSGPIPLQIGNLISIIKINIQSNGLTGKLPSELGSLKNLQELRLDRNKLRGTIPGADTYKFASSTRRVYASNASALGFCRSSPLKVVDFSYNFLFGRIPKCLNYLPRTSFKGNCLPYKDIKQRSPEQCGVAPPAKPHKIGETKLRPVEDKHKNQPRSSKPAWLLALEVVVGVMIGSLFLLALFTAVQRFQTKSSVPWKKPTADKHYMAIHIDADMLKGVRRFCRQELEVACEDFSNIIGSSSDSLVYKGIMKGGPEIAVISLCIREEHWTGYLELYYQKEVADLARLNHENTGKLLGYCIDSSPFTRMLVFEYASNGTLYEHLHYEEGCQLSWARRMKIIIGIAKGLKYLHTEIQPPFTLSELSSSSVYLTEDFKPKLVDFDSWKTILMRSENNSRSISNEGAICVLPSSLEGRQLDIQGNIYAFGVLLLEIISGRPPFCKDKGCLVDWAKDYLEKPEDLASVVDPGLKHFREDDLEVICEIVSICIHLRPKGQVSMKDFCEMLETKIDTSELKPSSLAWAELAISS